MSDSDPPQVLVVAGPGSREGAAVARLAELAGARSHLVGLEEAVPGAAAVIVLAEALLKCPVDQAVMVLSRLRGAPLLLLGLGPQAAALPIVNAGLDLRLKSRGGSHVREYRLADHALLGPLRGAVLSESEWRHVELLDPAGLDTFVAGARGTVHAALPGRSVPFHVSTATAWPDGPPAILKKHLGRERFLDVLPTLVFLREALRERAWRTPEVLATTIVDDPNLRRFEYGHLDFRRAAELGRRHDFHLSMGFVPLDYGATRKAVADFFRRNADRLSIVFHGNDHLKRELARPATAEGARFAMGQALMRMNAHRQATGLDCPPVMTMPHGASTPVWIDALREAGFTAAMTHRAYAFTDSPELHGALPTHEMLPAELSLGGFPLINRFPVEGPVEDLLFAAFLGKPLILYTHHDCFADGWDRYLELIDFINTRIKPRWGDPGDVARANFQVRRKGGRLEVRAFSNRIGLKFDWRGELVIRKEGRGLDPDAERLSLDGRLCDLTEASPERLVSQPFEPPSDGELRVAFLPAVQAQPRSWRRPHPVHLARRRLTEVRDRMAPAFP